MTTEQQPTSRAQRARELAEAMRSAGTDTHLQQPLGLEEGAGATGTSNTSPFVLDMDRWGQRRGAELAEEFNKPNIDAANLMEDRTKAEELLSKILRKPEVVADAHSALFEPEPRMAENPAEQQRAEWWRQLMDTPEYAALHNETALNSTLSAIAAKSIVDQWFEYAACEQPKEPEEGEPAPGSEAEPIADTMARLRSTAKALKQASETVQVAKDVAAWLGMGAAGEELDHRELLKYFDRVRNDAMLHDIMRMAGRMRILSAALQRTKTQHGRDDVVGVELSGDVSRLVPSELAQLACGVPEVEMLALARLAGRRSLSFQYRGKERLGKGPIVVCVDESGSMAAPKGSPKIVAAKALALALAWVAQQQRRWIAFVGFAGGTEGTRVAFPPGKMDQEKLLEWLTHFYGGRTTMDVPLAELPGRAVLAGTKQPISMFDEDGTGYWGEFRALGMPQGRTDVVLITDAIVRIPDRLRENYLKWAEAEQVKTYGIIVGRSDAGELPEVCDRHWCVPELSLDSDALGTVLSI